MVVKWLFVLVMRFYKKLGSGRVYMSQLNGIPGLILKQLSFNEVASAVQSGKPVVAVTSYFQAHAVLITEKDETTENFRAADPVSGMMIPLHDSEGRIDFIQYYQVEITDKDAFLASLPEPKKSEEPTMQERIMDAVKRNQ